MSLAQEDDRARGGPLDASPVGDLAQRWQRARRAALRTLVPDAPPDLEESALVPLAQEKDREAALKRTFENSQILGRGFSRYRAIDLTMVDLTAILPMLGAPCHLGGFGRAADEPACSSAAMPCALAGRGMCDHWRESIAGLVGGLSSTVYYTRVESAGHGAEVCSDLLHVQAETPKRFRPIPATILSELERIARQVHGIDPGAKVEFFGLMEGVLHYRVQPSPRSAASCSSGTAVACGIDVGGLVAHALRRRLPALEVCDASPRPVLSD